MAREPQRTCVGCRRGAPRRELVRLALRDGAVVVDERARLPGRGAWLHPRDECLEQARRRGAFARAFRRPVAVPVEKLDFEVR